MARSSALASTVLLAILLLYTSACVRRDGRNNDCTWPGESAANALDPSQPSASRHLFGDAEFAEELADRYTNVHFGPHSGYVGPPIAGRIRAECLVKLLDEVAKQHGVTREQVIASYGRNRRPIDLAEILSFAGVFAFLASIVVRRVWKRYPPAEEGWTPGIVFTLLCSLGAGVLAALAGPFWTQTIESIRIGTGHLGPRVMRLPMEHYTAVVFVAGMVLCWIVAILCRPSGKQQPAAGS